MIHLAAATKQEKLSWITDITQCMDNVHFDNLYNNTNPSVSSASVPQFVKSDPSLFKAKNFYVAQTPATSADVMTELTMSDVS